MGSLGLVVYGCAGGSEATESSGGDDGGSDGTATPLLDAAPPPPTNDAGPTPKDSGPVQTCVHNDDCQSPNLCLGTNGLACMGGICVPTGKPMNCDDGVACTQDSCDANTMKCTHKPDDTQCPNGSYCDPTMNCVTTLPCMPGDAVCDRLNMNACDGLWSCDGTVKHCVLGPKPCPDRTNASTMCSAGAAMDGGAGTSCAWTCKQGYVDLDHDLQTPPPGTSDGCECHQSSTTDAPDYTGTDSGFVDSNCDGIDGDVSKAIFVDGITGDDANPGTMGSPKKTLQAAINAAGAASPAKDVYASKGQYNEHLAMVNGVSLYGGYDAANHWARAMANITLVSSTSNVGIDARGLSTGFTIQFVSVTARAASGTAANGGGDSSYGVRVVSCTGGATIQGCTITAAAGASAPFVFPNGAAGSSGGRGGDASNSTLGGGGSSSCGATGGPGASGVGNVTPGNQGSQGTTVIGGGQGAAGGTGGGPGYCNTTSAGNGGNAPPVSSNGGNGSPGANAGAGPAVGSFDSSGNYLPAFGIMGLSAGTPGGGGGGGGSGGGTQHGCGFLNSGCCESDSGGGGGGGGGGCGGAPGGGGTGGGGSFAIVVVGSNVTSLANKLSTGIGGNGGPGGNGGTGGSGGGGGNGGNNTNAGDHPAGNGASGSSGGYGGQGGGGSGGPGGPSACFAYNGTSPASSGDTCSNAGGGNGGSGGQNGASTASSGPGGATGTVDVP